MRDFLKVLIMLLLVMGAVLIFIFLSDWLGFWGMVILEAIISVGIILLAIRFIRSRRT